MSGRGLAGPATKGAEERGLFARAYEVRDLTDAELAIREVADCESVARGVEQVAEAGVERGESALQRARAQAQASGAVRCRRRAVQEAVADSSPHASHERILRLCFAEAVGSREY